MSNPTLLDSTQRLFTTETLNFEENSFLNDLKDTNFELLTDDPNENYCFITDTFVKILEPHAPLKKRFFRENQAPFMSKELRKAIYTRSRLRNNSCKNPTKENEKKYKIQRNKCVSSLRKKSIKKYFKNISKDGVVSNKSFWTIMKPFLTNKGHINGEEIILKHDNETITESSVLAEMFNSHYINIVEKTSGKKPSHFARDNNVCL